VQIEVKEVRVPEALALMNVRTGIAPMNDLQRGSVLPDFSL
jgi:hypothetical protein